MNFDTSYAIHNIQRIEIMSNEGGLQNYAKAVFEVVKLAINNLKDCGLHAYYTFASVPLVWKERKLSIATNHAIRAFQHLLQFLSNSVALFIPVVAVRAASAIGTTQVWNVLEPQGVMGKTKFWLQRMLSVSRNFVHQENHPQGLLALKAVAVLAAIGVTGVFTHQILASSFRPSLPNAIRSKDWTLFSISMGSLAVLTIRVFYSVYGCMQNKSFKKNIGQKSPIANINKKPIPVEKLVEESVSDIERLKAEIAALDIEIGDICIKQNECEHQQLLELLSGIPILQLPSLEKKLENTLQVADLLSLPFNDGKLQIAKLEVEKARNDLILLNAKRQPKYLDSLQEKINQADDHLKQITVERDKMDKEMEDLRGKYSKAPNAEERQSIGLKRSQLAREFGTFCDTRLYPAQRASDEAKKEARILDESWYNSENCRLETNYQEAMVNLLIELQKKIAVKLSDICSNFEGEENKLILQNKKITDAIQKLRSEAIDDSLIEAINCFEMFPYKINEDDLSDLEEPALSLDLLFAVDLGSTDKIFQNEYLIDAADLTSDEEEYYG